MNDRDPGNEDAVRTARRRAQRRRLATLGAAATFFVVTALGFILAMELFPDPESTREQGRIRWQTVPVLALALASAYVVSKRLKPNW